MIHLGLQPGARRKMLECPASSGSVPAQVAGSPFPARPHSCGECWGGGGPRPLRVSARLGGGTKVSRASPPTGQFCESAFTCPVLGEGEQKRSFFMDILFLVCRYQKETQHWACSDVEWFADRQEPPGTKT